MSRTLCVRVSEEVYDTISSAAKEQERSLLWLSSKIIKNNITSFDWSKIEVQKNKGKTKKIGVVLDGNTLEYFDDMYVQSGLSKTDIITSIIRQNLMRTA